MAPDGQPVVRTRDLDAESVVGVTRVVRTVGDHLLQSVRTEQPAAEQGVSETGEIPCRGDDRTGRALGRFQ